MEKWLGTKHYKVTLLVLLMAGITIFSVYKYARSFNEKYKLTQSLKQTQSRLDETLQEKQNLLETLEKEKAAARKLEEENAKMLRNIKAGAKRLDKLFRDYARMEDSVEKVNAQLAGLQKEKEELNSQLKQATQERDDLQAKLTSISGLKKALRELRWQARKVGFQMKDAADSQGSDNLPGNQGFIVRDGKPTYPAKVKIDVSPAASEGKPSGGK